MKKNLFYPALWGILTLSIFYSCRTDSVTTEQTVASKEKIAAFERFEKQNNIVQPIAGANQTTTPQKYISYAKPFAEIISNFIQNHPDYAKWMDKSVGVIRLDVASQTFGEGKKAIIFPVTDENGKVTGAWYGIINEERSYVNFSYMNDNSLELADIKKTFQNYYDKKVGSLSSRAIASTSKLINPVALKNGNEQKPIDIEEVVITKKNPTTPPPDQWVPKYPDEPSGGGGAGSSGPGTGMSGGSGTHAGPNNEPPKTDDSCSKLKALQNTEEYKKRIDALEKKLKETNENGYIQDKYGNYSELTQRSESENSKSMRLPNDISNLRGFLHTHVKKTSVVIDGEVVEAEGVDMFSPADVERFLEIVKFSSDQGRPLDDAFGVMVSSSGNYTLKFTGDKNQIITKFQDNSLNIGVYLRYMQQTSGEFKNMSMEQKFLKYLDEYMNAKGVSLYKDNKNGTNTRMGLNDSNKKEMKKSDC
ncbi:hypothetical protein [Elizabethkingia miricola]|uniref:Uncharacterized protein n=1 Tax=Elizabethkingia miricola TaxID=172045 RepID=A0ABD5B6H0_ELIMR|nr:hypothetical protein [Elizabethkingia miricola]MDQ8748663.1 hypothetical protein [Elizabethkingia miricola]